MSYRSIVAAATLSVVALSGPTIASAAPAHAANVHGHTVVQRHACTRTSSGSCIRGGEFCPQSKFGQSGWDAVGRRYVCKGNRVHPHWMVP